MSQLSNATKILLSTAVGDPDCLERGSFAREKVALITGVGGQDGSYLAEFLLSKNYTVHGLLRHSSISNTQRLLHIMANDKFHIHHGDVTQSLYSLINAVKPDEIYNLAAQTAVQKSFDAPQYTLETNFNSVVDILEAIRSINPKIRLYQASSGDIYGTLSAVRDEPEGASCPSSPSPHNEKSCFRPCSPLAISKLGAHLFVQNYRDVYGLFAVNGIMFNHDSPRRGECFVTKKICAGAVNILFDLITHIELGNLNARRDWGHARDYVECMWKMLQQDTPRDFVISSGVSKTVREFADEAFKNIDMVLRWEGEGPNEVGVDQDGIVRVRVNSELFRPADIENLEGDSTKAREILQWRPRYAFEKIVEEMINIERMCLEEDLK